ncbi:MAG TPA: hypothetical protein VI959_03150, partial [Alphaproteobacteria bacterium]|nr:hypothetical protein [Alphaproteobacteria bacterium]
QIILVESLTNKKSFLEEENVNLLDTNKDLQTEIEALSQRLEPLTLSLQEESQKNGSLNEENLKLKGALRRYTKHKKTQRNKDEKTQLFLKNRIIEIGSLLRKTLEKKEVVKKTLSEENISLKTQLKSKEEELEKSLSVIEQQEKNILQLEFQKLCLKVGRNVSNPHRLFLDTLKKSPTLWTQKLNKNTLKPKL